MSGSKTPVKKAKTPIKGRRSDPTTNTAPYTARYHRGYHSSGEVPVNPSRHLLRPDCLYQDLGEGPSNPYPNLPVPLYPPRTELQHQSAGEGSSTLGVSTYQEGYGQFQRRPEVDQNPFPTGYYPQQPNTSDFDGDNSGTHAQHPDFQGPAKAYQEEHEPNQQLQAVDQIPYPAHAAYYPDRRLNPSDFQEGYYEPIQQLQAVHQNPQTAHTSYYPDWQLNPSETYVQHPKFQGRAEQNLAASDGAYQEGYEAIQQQQEMDQNPYAAYCPEGQFDPSAHETNKSEQHGQAFGANQSKSDATSSKDIITRRLYAFGGRSQRLRGIILQTVIYYDFDACEWKNAKDMPQRRMFFGAAEFQRKIWIVGGYGSPTDEPHSELRVVPDVMLYDPAKDGWTVGLAMKIGREKLGLAKYEDKLFAVGGQDAKGDVLRSVEIYNSVSRSWGKGVDMQRPRADMGIAATRNFLMVVGGEGYVSKKLKSSGLKGASPRVFKTEFFDSKSSQWTIAENLKTPGYPKCIAVVVEDTVYVLGGAAYGIHVYRNDSNDKEKYIWERLYPKSREPAKSGGCAAIDGKLYVVGGIYDRSDTKDVGCYNPVKNEMTYDDVKPLSCARLDARVVALNRIAQQ